MTTMSSLQAIIKENNENEPQLDSVRKRNMTKEEGEQVDRENILSKHPKDQQQLGYLGKEELTSQLDVTKKERLYRSTEDKKQTIGSKTATTTTVATNYSFSRSVYGMVLTITFLLTFATRWYKLSAGNFVL